MTLPSSTTSTAGSVTLEPTSPASVSTVRTSSTAAFSCLPPQRTIAYTRELSLCLVRALLWVRARTASTPIRTLELSDTRGSPALAPGWPGGPPPRIHPVGKVIRPCAELSPLLATRAASPGPGRRPGCCPPVCSPPGCRPPGCCPPRHPGRRHRVPGDRPHERRAPAREAPMD